MGLLSFLKRKSGEPAARPVGLPESVDSVQQARTRARQRLVGAVVLVAAGVIGFPLLFETQPRPLPGNTPIEIARKDGSVPAATPARTTPTPRATVASPAPSVITETPAEAGREVAPAASVPATPAVPVPKPEPKPEPKPTEPKPPAEAKPAAKPEAKPAAEGARAQALLEGKPAASKPAVADGRFVVQVGAFAEVTAAREARQKVEKLGLKTYTQVVETSTGKRIRVRVGPFASRDEAEKASTKIKSAGLGSAVYTL
jgi:DedD protein